MKTFDFTVYLFACALLSACGGEPSQIVSSASAGSLSDMHHGTSQFKASQSVAGRPAWAISVVDEDHNSLHDPVDAFINGLSATGGQKAALARMSVALDRATRTDPAYRIDMQEEVQTLAAAKNCMHARFGPEAAQQKMAAIEKLTLDTGARVRAYHRFKAASAGLVLDGSSGAACAG